MLGHNPSKLLKHFINPEQLQAGAIPGMENLGALPILQSLNKVMSMSSPAKIKKYSL